MLVHFHGGWLNNHEEHESFPPKCFPVCCNMYDKAVRVHHHSNQGNIIVYIVIIQDCFKLSNILELQSKISGNKLVLNKDGVLNCNGDGGPACKWFSILHITFPYFISQVNSR